MPSNSSEAFRLLRCLTTVPRLPQCHAGSIPGGDAHGGQVPRDEDDGGLCRFHTQEEDEKQGQKKAREAEQKQISLPEEQGESER